MRKGKPSAYASLGMYYGVSSTGFRFVDGFVCSGDQIHCAVPRLPPAYARAQGEGYFFAAQHDRGLAQGFGGTLQGTSYGRAIFFGLRCARQELVSPPPGDPVSLAHVAVQYPGEVDEAFVPGVVAMLVVYRLELVEVEKRQRKRSSPTLGPGDILREPFFRGPAVVDARKAVCGRSLVQGAHRRVKPLDGVLDVGHQPSRPVRVAHWQVRDLACVEVAAQDPGGQGHRFVEGVHRPERHRRPGQGGYHRDREYAQRSPQPEATKPHEVGEQGQQRHVGPEKGREEDLAEVALRERRPRERTIQPEFVLAHVVFLPQARRLCQGRRSTGPDDPGI